jgi:hypothetical protein
VVLDQRTEDCPSRKTREETEIEEEERGTDWGGYEEGIGEKRRRLIGGRVF